MTAEELRKGQSVVLKEFREQASPERQRAYAEIANTSVLFEVAAQLAELNANLLRIFHAENPDNFTKNFGPRLNVDVLK